MTAYRRNRVPGGCYFFTVTLQNRQSTLLVDHIDTLRAAVRRTRAARPFHIDACVILPDHLHCLWTLPPNDTDFSARWQSIKSTFSHAMARHAVYSCCRSTQYDNTWQHLPRLTGQTRMNRLFQVVVMLLSLCSYGTAAIAAKPFSVLHNFADSPDGYYPLGRMVIDRAGNIFGTAAGGGTANSGAIFEITAAKSYSIIVSMPLVNSINPGLFLNSEGLLIGSGGSAYPDCGVLFSVTEAGNLDIFYNFTNDGLLCNGSPSNTSIAENKAGQIFGGYSICSSYLMNECSSFVSGIFRYDPDGTVTLLDQGGSFPTYAASEYFIDKTGRFWADNTSVGVFSFTSKGKITQLSGPLGADDASFVQDAAGNLFGVSAGSGVKGDFGSVFGIVNPDAARPSIVSLHSFTYTDGAYPDGDVAIDKSGNLFGTTSQGGQYQAGTIYEISASGIFSSLYSFTGGKDGNHPLSGVVIGKDGAVYGTTISGGSYGQGVLFRYKP